jgi:hypothetical protein
VQNFDPDVLRFTAAQRECRVSDAHHERVAPGSRLGEDFHLLAVHEPELEQTALESRKRGGCTSADAEHTAAGAG